MRTTKPAGRRITIEAYDALLAERERLQATLADITAAVMAAGLEAPLRPAALGSLADAIRVLAAQRDQARTALTLARTVLELLGPTTRSQ